MSDPRSQCLGRLREAWAYLRSAAEVIEEHDAAHAQAILVIADEIKDRAGKLYPDPRQLGGGEK